MKFKEKNFEPQMRRPDYLREGENPITACIGTREQFEQYPGVERAMFQEEPWHLFLKSKNQHIDYYGHRRYLEKNRIMHDGDETYVISSISPDNQYSKGFYQCTGLVAVGKDKQTGKDISFISHQNPSHLFHAERSSERFRSDMETRLKEFRARCIPGTVDIVIMGGSYNPKFIKKEPEEYRRIIVLLGRLVKKTFTFEPLVITGPKETLTAENMFFDTASGKRRLFITREELGTSMTNSFYPRDIEDDKLEWQ